MITHIHVPRHRLLTAKQAMNIYQINEDKLNNWSQSGLIKRYEVGAPADYCFSEVEMKAAIEQETE
jgi:hypothetical protein